jgi:hypothetical protein
MMCSGASSGMRFSTVQFGKVMDSSQGMLTVRSSTKVQVAQKRRKEALYPAVLLHHFILKIWALLQIVGGDKLIIPFC